jgi:uncharacterized membrane protein YhaH (DUF805 family)
MRFRDRDKPGTTALYGYVPITVLILLYTFHLTGSHPSPNAIDGAALVVGMGVGLWLLIELGVRKRSPGPNRLRTS